MERPRDNGSDKQWGYPYHSGEEPPGLSPHGRADLNAMQLSEAHDELSLSSFPSCDRHVRHALVDRITGGTCRFIFRIQIEGNGEPKRHCHEAHGAYQCLQCNSPSPQMCIPIFGLAEHWQNANTKSRQCPDASQEGKGCAKPLSQII